MLYYVTPIVGSHDMDFYDPNRYAKRKFFNNLRDAIWSALIIMVLIVLALVALKYLLPWLNVIWRTVRYGE